MSFDLLAPHYRWLEAVLAGDKMQRCRTAWLDQVKNRRRALLIGEGNGRFLSACVRQLPDTHFTVVDGSAKMLERARRNWRRACGDEARVTFLHATVPGLTLPAGSFDLIVTHCFLDCFPRETLEVIIPEIAALAAPEAAWLIADFAVPEGGIARWRAKAILRLTYAFFRASTGLTAHELVPPTGYLEQNGFGRTGRSECNWGLMYSELWERQSPD